MRKWKQNRQEKKNNFRPEFYFLRFVFLLAVEGGGGRGGKKLAALKPEVIAAENHSYGQTFSPSFSSFSPFLFCQFFPIYAYQHPSDCLSTQTT